MCLAVPGKLLSVNGDDPLERTGRVSFGGVVKDVSLACVPEAKPGDYVLVHVGMALSVVDESEAQQVFEYLRQMEDLEELAAPGLAPPQNPGFSDEIRG
ncbi:HypC/HybG/HupF family hydrogenase formation chaperone [Limisphaera ngatamarikiensis]|uniref:HypC/HybG/HupF family hydrogenase formation chaperone n=1 Tax=Limisphaera ngatamarikiensis TaxID=1324935 RepID=A0A6M1RSD8_9BACT|nr:HypC/HybG/HupF family hydrogenase formation chaperone [Limisphaera ngatamarikiensis]NGO38394.1 HypC/HybG/HupF family hydrogenase formation chaperone [Limisphaera ngatamarikiensis]